MYLNIVSIMLANFSLLFGGLAEGRYLCLSLFILLAARLHMCIAITHFVFDFT